jgi:hypothetical protein
VVPGRPGGDLIDRRHLGGELLTRRHLAVEDAQRVFVPPALAIRAQLGTARSEGGTDRLLVTRPVLGITQVVEVDDEVVEPQPQEELVHRRKKLGVGQGGVRADDLEPDLRELPVPAALHPLVAKHRPDVVQAQGVAAIPEGVLDPRTGHPRRAFRAQRQRAPLAVRERVHLLVHDVRRLADRTDEELGGLEERRADLLSAERPEHLPGHPFDRLPESRFRR